MFDELKYGPYDFSELDALSQNFWLEFAKEGDLPDLPSEGGYKLFFKKFDTGVSGFPTMKAHVILTSDGKLRKVEDFDFDKHVGKKEDSK